MALSTGFQLSLELAQVFPIREGIESAVGHILQYARDLRKSGSDILVEEDLAAVFGRGKIAVKIDGEFRDAVKEAKIKPLHPTSLMTLKSGPGPTMVHAFQNPRYFATVIQLSLLGWTHERESLASALVKTMGKRFDLGVHGATMLPDYKCILGTLNACSSQSVDFAWDKYIQAVEAKLRTCIIGYRSTPDFLGLSPAVFLGCLDYLYLVQQLPESRSIIISTHTGSITLIIWAHYLLGLNVIVTLDGGSVAIFGAKETPHVTIIWSQQVIDHKAYPDPTATEIQLFDETMHVMLESSRDLNTERFNRIISEDRHTVSGYGTVFLHRKFNTDSITRDVDPIYRESVNLAIALAISTSKRIHCAFGIWDSSKPIYPSKPVYQETTIEIWRILAAARLIFPGICDDLDISSIECYAKLLSDISLDKFCLSESCTISLKEMRVNPHKKGMTSAAFQSCIIHLATIIMLFAHVMDIQNCKDMPICSNRGTSEIEISMKGLSQSPHSHVQLSADTIFKSISFLLTGKLDDAFQGLFLRSDFGWSIFLDTIGDKDPAHIRRDLVHIQRGIPTDTRTNEQKSYIHDGPVYKCNMYDGIGHVLRDKQIVPRSAAKVQKRTEYWNSLAENFELLVYFTIQQTHEWRQHHELEPFTESTSYRQMHDLLWQITFTQHCEHEHEQRISPDIIELGDDAVAVLGWNIHGEFERGLSAKIYIFLTRGESGLRWLAIKDAVHFMQDQENTMIRITLRIDECCDKCALEQAEAFTGRCILIL